MSGGTGGANRRSSVIKGAPARSLEGLAVSVHLLNEALWGLLFAKDDAERLEMVQAMARLGVQVSTEIMFVRGWLDTRRSRAGVRTPGAMSGPASRCSAEAG